jgi:thymidylate synthase (FAD)
MKHLQDDFEIEDISVEFLDKMGTDLTVVNAARVSFSKESVEFTDKDEKLIEYLAREQHWSPFAHTSIQFRVKAPIFIARQLVKHQVGGVWNEVSRRYVDTVPTFHSSLLRSRPKGSIKQGSGGYFEGEEMYKALEEFRTSARHSIGTYRNLLNAGVAPEQARGVLPLCTMTEWYWTGSLVFWARVCRQRLGHGAQQEAAELAELISNHLVGLFPVSWRALMGVEQHEF